MSCKSRVPFTLTISPIIISLIFAELPRILCLTFSLNLILKKNGPNEFGWFDINSRCKINVANNMIVVVGKRALSLLAGSCSHFSHWNILKWYCVLSHSSSNSNSNSEKKTTVSIVIRRSTSAKIGKNKRIKHTCMTLNKKSILYVERIFARAIFANGCYWVC